VTTVLITRPSAASRRLADQLGQLGTRAIIMPLYTFNPRDPGLDIRKLLAASKNRNLALFTSPRAVQFGLEHIPLDLHEKLEFAAVGSATRKLLEADGHQVEVQARHGFTSEDLLQVPELTANPGTAVIFCAPGGREKLASGLHDLGWAVTMAMVYERQPQRPAQDLVDRLIAAEELLSIWTSVAAFDLAREYLPAVAWRKILHAPALVISARIKHHLQLAGVKQVGVAQGPGNTGLLKSLQVELSEKG